VSDKEKREQRWRASAHIQFLIKQLRKQREQKRMSVETVQKCKETIKRLKRLKDEEMTGIG
jgi:prefoldin subunit 5